MHGEQNPYAPPSPSVERPRSESWIHNGKRPVYLAVLHIAILSVGTCVLFVELRYASITGFLLTVFGSALAYRASRQGCQRLTILGASGPVISIVCFVVIFLTGMTPRQGDIPLKVLGLSYCLVGWFLFTSEFIPTHSGATRTTDERHKNGGW